MSPQSFPFHTQTRLVCAMAVLHNFIMLHDPDDMPDWEPEVNELPNYVYGTKGTGVSHAEVVRANIRCDQIAQAMWEDYQKTLQRRQ